MNENNDLSDRELEILKLVATGASNKEIAQKLFISLNTVKVHLRNIFVKIGVASRTEAAMYAVKAGYVESIPQEGDQPTYPKIAGLIIDGKAARLIIGFLAILLVGLSVAAYWYWQTTNQRSTELASSIRTPNWQTLAPMPTARAGLAAAAYENLIYTIAGESVEGVTGVVERYDPASNKWSEASSKPTQVTDVSAAVLGGKIYVPGGRLSSGEVTNVMEIYDPEQDKWSQSDPLPHPASAYALIAFEGKLYLFGGWDGHQYLKTAFEYDPGKKQWKEKSPLSSARAFMGVALAGGHIHVVGGFDGKEALDINEIYSPNLDETVESPWEQSSPLPQPRYAMGIASLTDVIYMVGGRNSNNSVLPSIGFAAQTGEWKEISTPSAGLWTNLGLTTLGTRIHAMGGILDRTPTTRNMAYQVIYITVLPFIK